MSKKEDKKAVKPATVPLNPDGTPMSKYQVWKMNHPDAAKGKGKKPVAKPAENPASAEPHALPTAEPKPVAKKIESPKPAVRAPKKARREADDEAVENTKLTLDEMFDDIKKQFGDESVFVPALMDVGSYPQVERIPITSPKMTDLMGGGVPKARHLELYGEESSGKTSIACYLAGQVQAAGGIVAYVDVEQALDLEYAKSFGLDVDHMLFSQPSSGEKALDMVEAYVRKRVDCVVVDSVAMLVPQAEIDGEMGDAHMALQARMMSKALRKLTSAQAESKTVIIWINQTRVAIGQWAPHGQVPKSTSGGQALKFAATIRIEVKKKELEMDKDGEAVSQLIRLKTVKNKVAPPFRIREIRIRFGQGIEMDRDWFDYAVTFGVIVRRGGGHTFPSVNGAETQHKEPSGEKAWEYFKSISVFDRSSIIQATKDAMAAAKSTPTVITAETVESGIQKATRVTEEDEASTEEGADAARDD